MNIEQRIKEIEEISKGNRSDGTSWHDGRIDMAQEALEVINHLQSEVERYKSLWEANAAESEEIIAELKEALTFYADKKHIGKDCHHYPTIKDDGKVARKILKPNSSE